MGVIFCIYVCSRYLYLLPMVFRKGCQISWNWIYRQLWDSMWVLEIEFGSSSRAQRYFTAVSIHSFHLTFSDSVSHWSWSLPIQWPNANKKQSESGWVYFRLKVKRIQSMMVEKTWRQKCEVVCHTASSIRNLSQI